MLGSRLRRSLRVQRIGLSLFGVFLGLLLSVLANDLANQRTWIPWVTGGALIAGAVALVAFMHSRDDIETIIKSPLTIRSEHEAQQYGRRAYVGFVPPYRPQRGSPAVVLTVEEQQAALVAHDFDALHVSKSNLQPTIWAILSHPRLQHCWLLATTSAASTGSLPTAEFLVGYLRARHNLQCEFHYGPSHAISMDDDALVLSKTYDQVKEAFAQAEGFQIPAPQIVADITTGVRSMVLGMVLASLDRDHDIEFVGTQYDAAGDPTGPLFPIIFGFEPVLKSE